VIGNEYVLIISDSVIVQFYGLVVWQGKGPYECSLGPSTTVKKASKKKVEAGLLEMVVMVWD
jgi:hypothetical protein